MRFKLQRNPGNQQQFFWHFRSSNGRVIAVSGEFYANKSDAQHGINLVKGTTSLSQYSFYKDNAGEWRFRLVATNGKNICAASEGYKNEADCRSACQLLVDTNANTPVDNET